MLQNAWKNDLLLLVTFADLTTLSLWTHCGRLATGMTFWHLHRGIVEHLADRRTLKAVKYCLANII